LVSPLPVGATCSDAENFEIAPLVATEPVLHRIDVVWTGGRHRV